MKTYWIDLLSAKRADLTPTKDEFEDNFESWLIVGKKTNKAYIYQKYAGDICLPADYFAVCIYSPLGLNPDSNPKIGIRDVKKLTDDIRKRQEVGIYLIGGKALHVGKSS